MITRRLFVAGTMAASFVKTPAFAAETVKVGLILPMTGPFASTGRQVQAGINAFIFASQYDVRQDTVAKMIVVSTLSSTLVASVLLGWFMA